LAGEALQLYPMPNEDIEVRITKTGEIYVKVENATEERLRDYNAFLQEMIGPIISAVPIDRPDWSKPAQLTEEEETEREQQVER
jgi:hypothetical protein